MASKPTRLTGRTGAREIGPMRRLIVGITGSTGAIFGVRLLEALRSTDVESHLIISKWGQRTLEHETPYTVDELKGLA